MSRDLAKEECGTAAGHSDIRFAKSRDIYPKEFWEGAFMKSQEPIHYNRRGSYCPLSDHAFAESVAADIYEATKDYYGCTLEVECYTPPYDPPLSTDAARGGGFLVLHLSSHSLPHASVGIEFGRLDAGSRLLRETIDVTEWRTDPANPLYAGVYAANFDEAWRIVCLLGLMLKVAEVRLGYGD
jgi:hypothetical protein